MFYIFNKKGELITNCDFEVNEEDLETREEFAIEHDEIDEKKHISANEKTKKIIIKSGAPSSFHVMENGKWMRDDNAYKLHLEQSLMILVDSKQTEAERLILGYKATSKQIERYKDKYERAKDGEFKAAENKIIIAKYEAMLSAIRQFVDLIEAFRSAVDDLLSNYLLDKADKAIEAGKAFNASTKPAQIKKLFKQLETK